jgi:hypothetical protein
MAKKIIKLGQETDWYYTENRNLYAVNRDTRLFENTSWTEGMTMVLYDGEVKNFDPADVSNDLAEFLRDGKDYEFALYNGQHDLVGYVYYEEQ